VKKGNHVFETPMDDNLSERSIERLELRKKDGSELPESSQILWPSTSVDEKTEEKKPES